MTKEERQQRRAEKKRINAEWKKQQKEIDKQERQEHRHYILGDILLLILDNFFNG